jgi:hypothetical protein
VYTTRIQDLDQQLTVRAFTGTTGAGTSTVPLWFVLPIEDER